MKTENIKQILNECKYNNYYDITIVDYDDIIIRKITKEERIRKNRKEKFIKLDIL